MPPPPSNPCSALAGRDFAAIPDAPTAIFSAQVVPATAGTTEYCEVKGYVTPQIQFEVRLPTQNWNRRYLQVGCGGYCGSCTLCTMYTSIKDPEFFLNAVSSSSLSPRCITLDSDMIVVDPSSNSIPAAVFDTDVTLLFDRLV